MTLVNYKPADYTRYYYHTISYVFKDIEVMSKRMGIQMGAFASDQSLIIAT